MRLPLYPGALRHAVMVALAEDKHDAVTTASAAEGEGILADLESSGWLERS